MALQTPVLKAGIKALLVDMKSRNESSEEEFADRLAALIETFVKSGEIPIGLVVSTPNGPGATTQPGKLI